MATGQLERKLGKRGRYMKGKYEKQQLPSFTTSAKTEQESFQGVRHHIRDRSHSAASVHHLHMGMH
ncbi:hypothetical protein T01_7520 [Trichinella spiralis]|uniref:Uncharacterized protein n=1 Tax=Trichinella spiralis TaxID=6334 RepID=A0A0V1AM16_TRISP|nr:hypothetical protein T01_7520 [Trichinella spiralis]